MICTYQYRIVKANAEHQDWQPRIYTWKTRLGARKAAARWHRDMAAQNCPVDVRVGYIKDNHFVPLETYPASMKSEDIK